MLTTEEKIIDFFARRRVKIEPKHAKYLIRLVKNEISDEWATVIKHKWACKGEIESYEVIISEQVPIELLNRLIQRPVKEVKGFYMYRVIKPNGETQEYYTIRENLFR